MTRPGARAGAQATGRGGPSAGPGRRRRLALRRVGMGPKPLRAGPSVPWPLAAVAVTMDVSAIFGGGSGIYCPAFTKATYAELLRRAASLLSHGELVVADASWTSAEHRSAAAAVARGASARLVPLRCAAPAGLAMQRLATRAAGASDADRSVARQMAAAMAPWPEAVTIDTSRGSPAGENDHSGVPGDVVAQAIRAIRPPQRTSVRHPHEPYMPPG